MAVTEPTLLAIETTLARPTRTRRLLHVGVRAIGGAIAIALLVRSAVGTDMHRVAALISRVGPWAAIALMPFVALMLFETLGWLSLFDLLGVRPRFRSLLRIRTACEAAALSLPGGAVVADGLKVALGRSRL